MTPEEPLDDEMFINQNFLANGPIRKAGVKTNMINPVSSAPAVSQAVAPQNTAQAKPQQASPANATLKRFRTANSSCEAFGHEVEISVLGVTTVLIVYFFADASINKNVLGRVGWLDRVRLGLVDHDTTMYLAPYDTE